MFRLFLFLAAIVTVRGYGRSGFGGVLPDDAKPPPEFALGSLNWRIHRRLPCSSERNMQRATSVILPAITSDLHPARAPGVPRGIALRTARGMAYKCA